MAERKEAFMRIIVAVVSGIILGLWKVLIQVLTVIHWIYVIFSGKRIKELADFCEIWNTQTYTFLKYLTFVSNERPFPFRKIKKSISNFK